MEGERFDQPNLFNSSPIELGKFKANNITFKLSNLDVGNNIVSSDKANGTYDVGDNSGRHAWWSTVFRTNNNGDSSAGSKHHTEGFNAKFNYFDCNPTYRTDLSAPDTLIDWYGVGEFGKTPEGRYDNYVKFNEREGNQFQSNAVLVQGSSPQPFYKLDRVNWKFQLLDSSLIGCKSTPPEVANVLGISKDYSAPGPVVRE